jgi:membrane-associated phospholipid phosphatase
MPILILATGYVMFGIFGVQSWGWPCLLILALALIGTRKDAKNITWGRFMPAGFITLLIFYMTFKHAGPFWSNVVGWQTDNIRHAFKWNDAFNSIPLNDGWIFRLWQPDWLTGYFKWVYNNGFTLSYWICVIRAFFTKDVKKLGLYALGGYLLQTPLILPFYNTILLQEVWYVQGVPDMLARALTPAEQFTTAWNCFPSMHTSIAFAAILLASREKSKSFRAVIYIYCSSIIISTMYLKIHWMLDVVGGMLFAWVCVWLAGLIVNANFYERFTLWFENLTAKWDGKGASGVPGALQMAATKESDTK